MNLIEELKAQLDSGLHPDISSLVLTRIIMALEAGNQIHSDLVFAMQTADIGLNYEALNAWEEAIK